MSLRIFFIDNNVICEQKQFYFFLPTVYTFSTGRTAHTRISSGILKRSDVGDPFVPDLSEKNLIFLINYDVSCWIFVETVYQVKISLYFWVDWVFSLSWKGVRHGLIFTNKFKFIFIKEENMVLSKFWGRSLCGDPFWFNRYDIPPQESNETFFVVKYNQFSVSYVLEMIIIYIFLLWVTGIALAVYLYIT